MNKIDIPDAKIRERIATEFDKSFFVEAGAGSGKTRSLVDRMTGIIKCGRAAIENMAAVTFTRKAAVELRERVQIKLEKILHKEGVSEQERTYTGKALDGFERVSISTIHSFCARLLRERPVEAGIDPGFEAIEEDDDKIFAEQAWAEYVEKQGFENNRVTGWMQENGVSPATLKDIYLKLVKYTDVDVVREDVPAPDFKEEKEQVRKFIYYLRKQIPGKEPEKGWDTLQSMIRRALKLFSLGYLKEERLFIVLLEILEKDPKITQNRWLEGNSKDCRKAMLEFQRDVIGPALTKWREYMHKPLIEFALGGVEYYQAWRRERSILNFQDLLMRTAGMLRGNAEVRGYFKKSIAFLLVDELQDTDPIQAEIVMLLAGEDNSVSDWRKVKPKPGSLFLVGDPKQSIYRFRRADIDIYNQIKAIFIQGAGEVVELTANFRSLDPISDITNTVFRKIFSENDTQCQAKFAPLNTVRGKSDKYVNGVFENRIDNVGGNKPRLAAERDAGDIAAWINNSIRGGMKFERTEDEKNAGVSEEAKPGDFMIITKMKKHLPVYARALEVMGIPYEISGGENFSNSEELYQIYKVLKATADLKNPVALVAALRGPFFGVSDNDLYRFKRVGGRFSYFSQPRNGPEIIRKAFARFRDYNDMVIHNTPIVAIEKIIEKLGVIPQAMSEEMGSSRAGNILKAIELLRGRKPDNIGSFPELVDYLLSLRETKGIEEMTLFPGSARAVRLMNLHKAKGLEATVVFLADPLGIYEGYTPQFHVKRSGDRSMGFFSIRNPRGKHGEIMAQPQGWEKRAEDEKEYASAEKGRLDYVAVTRAKNILVVSTYYKGDKGRAWKSLYDYLDGMPKLETKETEAPGKKKRFEVNEKEWADEKKKMAENIRKMCPESYHTEKVTGLIGKEDVFTAEHGEGTGWGLIVHNALEACGRGKRDKLEILARNWLAGQGRQQEGLKRLCGLVDGVMASNVWQRAVKAEEKYFEVPFSTKKDNTVITGVIDLIFKEADGWVVVDYKTDDFEADPKRKVVYEKQIEMYSALWEEIAGERVKERMLYKVG